MTIVIPPHAFRMGNVAGIMAPVVAAAQEAVQGMETSEDDRYDALPFALSAAKWRCLQDPVVGDLETWESWILAMQVGSALFASGHRAGGPGGLPGRGLGRGAEAARDRPAGLPARRELAHFLLSGGDLLRERAGEAAGADPGGVPTRLRRGVRRLRLRLDRDPPALLFRPLAGLGDPGHRSPGHRPENALIADSELLLKILYPPQELFQLYLRREDQAFNGSLANALTWHKEYWTANEARSLSGDGLVALAPLAIACMAHDADMPIDVESEYLPKHLLKRTRVGEFPT